MEAGSSCLRSLAMSRSVKIRQDGAVYRARCVSRPSRDEASRFPSLVLADLTQIAAMACVSTCLRSQCITSAKFNRPLCTFLLDTAAVLSLSLRTPYGGAAASGQERRFVHSRALVDGLRSLDSDPTFRLDLTPTHFLPFLPYHHLVSQAPP